MKADDGEKEKENEKSNEEMRKLLKPTPTESDIVTALKASYGSPPKGEKDVKGYSDVRVVKKLDSYDDMNYLVLMDGTKFLAKVRNGVESGDYLQALDSDGKDSRIHFYNDITRHLNDAKYGAMTNAVVPVTVGSTVTRPVSATDGKNKKEVAYEVKKGDDVSLHLLPVHSPAHSPCVLVVQVLTWIEGPTMSSLSRVPIEQVMEAGQFLGKVCSALDDFPAKSYPKSLLEYRHEWDGKNLLDLKPFIKCISNDSIKKRVESIVKTFERDILCVDTDPNDNAAPANAFRRGLNMGDYNDANIIADDTAGANIKGVIDFGDSVYSWRVLDISVAMMYAMVNPFAKSTHHSLASAAAMLRGFHSVYPLTDLERKHLRLLVAARLAQSITWGAFSVQENPENAEYLSLHAKPAWRALELIWGDGVDGKQSVDVSSIETLFDVACEGCSSQEKSAGDTKCSLSCEDIAIPDIDVYDILSTGRTEVFSGRGSLKRKHADTSVTREDSGQKAKKESGETSSSVPPITFVTGNKKKLEEVKAILSGSRDENNDSSTSTSNLPFDIVNQRIDLPELQGEPEDIAKEKCKLASERLGGAVLTEDTSLCFHALKELPGPYIKWFLDKLGHEGLNNLLAGHEDKSAYAQTLVAFCPAPGEEVIVLEGRTQGKIVPARGPKDFGWDPIFEPEEGQGLTYAEMEKDAKNQISHRGRALAKLRTFMLEKEGEIKKKMGLL